MLEIKHDLGVRTQGAYLAKDLDLLRGLLNEYRELEKMLNAFYKRFRSQWERECKSYGFEKHDIRLGGLRCRVRNCRRMLSNYLSGKRKAIPMLEEEKLPFSRAGQDGKAVIYNAWHETAMIKPFS